MVHRSLLSNVERSGFGDFMDKANPLDILSVPGPHVEFVRGQMYHSKGQCMKGDPKDPSTDPQGPDW